MGHLEQDGYLVPWLSRDIFTKKVSKVHIIIHILKECPRTPLILRGGWLCQKWPFYTCCKESKMSLGTKNILKQALLCLGKRQVHALSLGFLVVSTYIQYPLSPPPFFIERYSIVFVIKIFNWILKWLLSADISIPIW